MAKATARMAQAVLGTLIALFALSCALVVSTDSYDTKDAPVSLFVVSGTVDGLGGASATILVNGSSPIVVNDGPFAFPAIVADGADYLVALRDAPLGHPCTIEHAAGTIHHAAATDVAIHCPSANATLDALVASAGALSPAFEPAKLAYTVGPLRVPSALFPATAATTTLTAKTHDPGATVTIAGVLTQPGKPSAAIALAPGPNPIDVAVTAPDRATVTHYTITVVGRPNDYLKASNPAVNETFGFAVAIDGDTVAVGAIDGVLGNGDTSCASGVNPPLPGPICQTPTGGVYVFARSGGKWTQQAYVKPFNMRQDALFGISVALSGDTLVVGSSAESSAATGIDGDPSEDPAITDTGAGRCYPHCGGGAVYVFSRTAGQWAQTAYIKSSHTREFAAFGNAVAISGNTIAVGAPGEASKATGIDGDQSVDRTTYADAGAVFVFTRPSGDPAAKWAQQAYVKASNTSAAALFGTSVAIDGDTLAVGSPGDASTAKGIDDLAHQNDFAATPSGAAYVFARTGATWSQQAFIKASVPAQGAQLGTSLAVAGDTVVVGAPLDGPPLSPGAVYVFGRTGAVWTQRAFVAPPTPQREGGFGTSVAMTGGKLLLVGMPGDASGAIGLNGDAADRSAATSGAAFLFTRSGEAWSQKAFIKASNTRASARFGTSVGLTSGGLVVGAPGEASGAKGVDGNEADSSSLASGAAYVF